MQKLASTSTVTWLIATSVALGGAAGVVAIATTAEPAVIADAPPAVAITSEEAIRVQLADVPADTRTAEAPVRDPKELRLAFHAGGAHYVKLDAFLGDDEDGGVIPEHGKLRMYDEDGTITAIAKVADTDMPETLRGMRGDKLVLESGCIATVDGYALISRLTGDPGYAGIEGTEKWTANAVLDHGSRMLAVRITGCGKRDASSYARSATLPPVVVPTEIHDTALAQQARSLMIASPEGKQTAEDWNANAGDAEDGKRVRWSDAATWNIQVLRHPTTNVTWIVAHASFLESCGGPDVNLYGLFRATADRSLEQVDLRKLDELHAITKVIDIDGDGQLELIGHPWLGLDTVVVDAATQDVIERLTLPFYGCPC